MAEKILWATAYGFNELDGIPFDVPIGSSGTDLIFALLRNGRNVKLTLHKHNGTRVEYYLVEKEVAQ